MGNVFSGVSVVILVIVCISLYTFAFLAGLGLGQNLERTTKQRHRRRDHAAGEDEDDHGRRQTPAAAKETAGDDYLYSSAVIQRKSMTTARSRPVITQVGPWGGCGGRPFDMIPSTIPRRLNSITLFHSSGAIHSLYFDYYIQQQQQHGGRDRHGQLKLMNHGPWGQASSYNSIAVRDEIKLSAREQVIAVEGTVGRFRDVDEPVITSLTFRTNAGKTYGPYGGAGNKQGTPFSIPVEKGCIVVGFWGRCGWLLDAIGVYRQGTMEMVERRFSWLAVVIIVLVSISVYTCSFLAGVALGRTLERRNNLQPSSIDGAVDDTETTLPGRRSSSSWVVKKVGPWGGSGGWHDFGVRGSRSAAVLPRQLNSIVLYHSHGAIHSFYYDYYIQVQPQQGGGYDQLNLVKNGPWGQKYSFDSIAVRETIKLSDDEQVTAVEGTFGHFRDVVEPVITSLTFHTNTGRTYGPYGGAGEPGSGTPFSIPAEEGGVIVGFWGRAGWLVDSIGVYKRDEKAKKRKTVGKEKNKRAADHTSFSMSMRCSAAGVVGNPPPLAAPPPPPPPLCPASFFSIVAARSGGRCHSPALPTTSTHAPPSIESFRPPGKGGGGAADGGGGGVGAVDGEEGGAVWLGGAPPGRGGGGKVVVGREGGGGGVVRLRVEVGGGE
uniref:Jacalin-type lectin domain-containing protein n=1 Tax=Oryza punctata TaxID=4537 RepID=A0A0E0KMB9_ORYPU